MCERKLTVREIVYVNVPRDFMYGSQVREMVYEFVA
jgi:hypothetical protein